VILSLKWHNFADLHIWQSTQLAIHNTKQHAQVLYSRPMPTWVTMQSIGQINVCCTSPNADLHPALYWQGRCMR
jgi:hypothetical protein